MTPMDLILIVSTVVAAGAFLLGQHVGRRSERKRQDQRTERWNTRLFHWVEACAFYCSVVERAYPDPTTRAIALNRVADEQQLGPEDRDRFDIPPPPDTTLTERTHPDGAYS